MINEAVCDSAPALAVKVEDVVSHLLPLSGGAWALWRCVGLRGSGFASNDVLKLADADCAAAADRVLASETESVHARGRAIESLRSILVQSGGTAYERVESEKAIRRLQKGKLPPDQNVVAGGIREVEDYRQALKRIEGARAGFLSEFEAAGSRTSHVVREIASDDRFREAVIWQNRTAHETGFKRLFKSSSEIRARDSKQRQSEELVA